MIRGQGSENWTYRRALLVYVILYTHRNINVKIELGSQKQGPIRQNSEAFEWKRRVTKYNELCSSTRIPFRNQISNQVQHLRWTLEDSVCNGKYRLLFMLWLRQSRLIATDYCTLRISLSSNYLSSSCSYDSMNANQDRASRKEMDWKYLQNIWHISENASPIAYCLYLCIKYPPCPTNPEEKKLQRNGGEKKTNKSLRKLPNPLTSVCHCGGCSHHKIIHFIHGRDWDGRRRPGICNMIYWYELIRKND